MAMMQKSVLLLLLTLTAVAHAGSIDDELYSAIHGRWQSTAMDVIMESADRLGSREVSLGLLLTLSTFGDEKARDASKLCVVSLVSGQLACGALKAVVNRPRPEEESSSRWNSSFPSGHAAGAFSLATVLSNRYPRWRPVFYFVASAVALSRVYLGRHYPSDVLAGSLIGYASSRVVLTHEAAVLKFTF